MPPDPEHIESEPRERPRWKHGRIPVVGLVGGIGAGKSRVADEFAKRGFLVVDADRVGHGVLRDPAIARRVVATFGDRVVAAPIAVNGPGDGSLIAEASTDGSISNREYADGSISNREAADGSSRCGTSSDAGEIDRRALGRIVFADPAELRRLEAIVHPPMRDEFERLIRGAVADQSAPGVVIDAAILFEAGWNQLCDSVVFVDSSRPVRLARLVAARGYHEADLAAREATQLPLKNKRDRADFVVDNDGTEADLAARVDHLTARIALENAPTDRFDRRGLSRSNEPSSFNG